MRTARIAMAAAAAALTVGGAASAKAQTGPTSAYVDCPPAVRANRAFITTRMPGDRQRRTKMVPMPLLGGSYYCSEEKFPGGSMVMPYVHEEGFLKGVRYRLDLTSGSVDIWAGADVKGRLRDPENPVSPFKCLILAEKVLCSGVIYAPDMGEDMLSAFSAARVSLDWGPAGREVTISDGPSRPDDPPAQVTAGGRTWTIPWATYSQPGSMPVTLARLKGPEADALAAAIARSKTITVRTRGGPAKVWPTGNAPDLIRVTDALAAKLSAVVRWGP